GKYWDSLAGPVDHLSSSPLRGDTDVSQESAGLSPGSPRILSGSRTAALPNIGMFCKTRRPKPNRRADCRCFVITSLPEPVYPSISNQRNLYENAAFGL